MRLLLTALPLLGGILVGCSSNEADTAPLPREGSERRTETATRNVEASTMTPAQKAAAIEYLKNGAEGARKTEAAARQAQGVAGN